MKYLWSGVVVLIFMMSCQNSSVDEQLKSELSASKAQLELLEKQLDEIKGQHTIEDRKFVHQVYFNLKTDLSSEDILKFEEALNSLSRIVGVKDLSVGKPADTGDSRLVSDYDYVLSMNFKTMDELKSYAKDEHHMEVKKEVGSMLAKAPIVYDFLIE